MHEANDNDSNIIVLRHETVGKQNEKEQSIKLTE
jgi:hypothetical protein